MTTYYQLIEAKPQYIDSDGNPYSGGKLYFYEAGTTTPLTTYTTPTGTAHASPIVLDSAGRIPDASGVFLSADTYKEVLHDANDVEIYSVDNLLSLSTVLGGVGSSVPINGIIMFSGTLTSLAANWVLCDGTNGTPDLGDKFVLGAQNQGEITDTGGSADAVVVTHTHTGSTDTDAGHTHDISGANIDDTDATNRVHVGGLQANLTQATETGGSHSHVVTVDSAGVSGTDANLPPYYKLAYIMRIS